jgi:hypothetical protein
MALSDLAIFNEYAYTSMTEVVAQQVQLFNEASRGTITMRDSAHVGDYNEETMFKKITGLVRRRNPYGTSARTVKQLQDLTDTHVKIAGGTEQIDLSGAYFKWLQRNPADAGAAMGLQLAGDSLQDMLNTAVMAGRVAIGQTAAVVTDVSAATVPTMTPASLVKAASTFGDRSAALVAWVMHSKPLHDFYGSAVANTAILFKYDTINVIADPFGRIFVVSDSPSLVVAGKYHTLGLTPGALYIDRNNDFTDNIDSLNGGENIKQTYQAEWSYNLGVKGYAWDKTNGGHAPSDAAIATSTNWDKYVTSDKDGPGVVLITS